MRFPSICWRVTLSVKVVVALTVLLILAAILLLSVQAASIYIVDNDANVGSYAMTIIDGRPVMVYYDDVTKVIKLAVCANAACETGTSTIKTLITTNDHTNVVMTAVDGHPFIVYSGTNIKKLSAIACNDLLCSTPVITEIIGLSNSNSTVEDVTVANDKPLIVYRDVSTDRSQAMLKTAACDDATCSAVTLSTIYVDAEVKWGDEFRAGYSNGYPIIVVSHDNQLKMAVCANVFCTGIPYWRTLDVNNLSSNYRSDLALTLVDSKPLIIYQTVQYDEMRVAACVDITCAMPPIVTAYPFTVDYGLTVTSLGSFGAFIHSGTSESIYLSTCVDAACTASTTEILPIYDPQLLAPSLTNVNGSVGLAYQSFFDNRSPLSYYFGGDYTPAHTPTPSPTRTPSSTPSNTPLPPTATDTFTPVPTLTPSRTPPDTPTSSGPTSTFRPTLTPLPPLPTSFVTPQLRVLEDNTWLTQADIKLDSHGIPVAVYSAQNDLRLLRCDSATCDSPTITILETLQNFEDFSFVLDSGDNPIISYNNYVTGDVIYMRCNNPVCDVPTRRVIDNLLYSSDISIVLDIIDNPYITYYKHPSAVDSGVKLVRCTDVNCDSFTVWIIQTSDLISVDQMVLNLMSYGAPIIAYGYTREFNEGGIHLAICESAISCTSPNQNNILTDRKVTGLINFIGPSSVGSLIGFTSTTDYHDVTVNLAICNNLVPCNAPIVSQIQALPPTGADFGMSNAAGRLMFSYYENGIRKDLRLALCNELPCDAPTIILLDSVGEVGYEASATMDETGRVYAIYSRYPASNAKGDIVFYIGRPFDPPPGPVLITPTAPADAIPQQNYFTTHEPVLAWGNITWAAGYAIQIDDVPDFETPIWADELISGSALSYRTPRLDNGTYFWRVRAKRSDGSWGSWSAVESFVVSAP